MTFVDKIRYNRIYQQVTHKRGESAIKYIQIFQNAQSLSFSVGNKYSEDKLMQIFLNNFHKGGKYSAQRAIHQAELRREGYITNKNLYLFHTYRLTI